MTDGPVTDGPVTDDPVTDDPVTPGPARAPMLPRPSICLHIPKTGSTWVDWFFNAADWLSLRRSFRARRLAMPHRASLELVRRIKRHGPAFGNQRHVPRAHR